MLETFLPELIHYKVAEPWMWETPGTLQEEYLVERAVIKRKREFRAGRHAARFLFESLKIEHPHLLKGIQREPAWPNGWVGSISHTQGICMVILASQSDYLSIGLDAEQATPLNPELTEMICRPEEIDALRALRVRTGTDLALEKMVFSAKESIHKTYFPLNHHTLDFLDARIDLDWERQAFDAWILNPEPQPKLDIKHLQGKFLFYQDWILTYIAYPKPAINPLPVNGN